MWTPGAGRTYGACGLGNNIRLEAMVYFSSRVPVDPPRFGFFGRFLIGAERAYECDFDREVPWKSSTVQVWDRDGARLCVERNPRLDELHIRQSRRGVVLLDGRIDEIKNGSPIAPTQANDRSPTIQLVEFMQAEGMPSNDQIGDLVGDFAAIDWNSEERIIRLCRDPFGTRSLFYHLANGILSLASDLAILISRLPGPFALDLAQAGAWLVPTGTPVCLADRTALRGVMKVPPGTMVEIDRSRVRVRRFWRPEDVPVASKRSLVESVRKVSETVSRSVASRIPAQGPFASHLSGGLDCSTICGIIATEFPHAADRCDFISWTPQLAADFGASELDTINVLAQAWQIQVEHLSKELLESELLKPEGRLFDPSINRTMAAFEGLVLRSISSNCSVVMSGWGGDEFASGHGWGAPMELLSRGRWLELAKFMIRSDPQYGFRAIFSSILRFTRWLFPAVRVNLSKNRLRRDEVLGDPLEYRSLDVNYHSSVRAAQESAYWSGHLFDRIESWSSLGRSFGVQYVYPLLDRRVVELAMSLPGDHFCNGRESRIVFRQMANQVWPSGMAENARKHEPGLSGLLGETVRPSRDESALLEGLVRAIQENSDVFSLLPSHLQTVVRRGNPQEKIERLRPIKQGVSLILDTLDWIRWANKSRTPVADSLN